MKKFAFRLLCCLLCAVLLLPFAACDSHEEEPSKEPVSEETSKKPEVPSDNLGFEPGVDVTAPLKTDSMPYLTLPKAKGDFIQMPLCGGWPKTRWDSHFMMLKQAGYEFIILQNTVEIVGGKLTKVGYVPKHLADKSVYADSVTQQAEFMETVLTSAKDTGMKVMIGIGCDNDWWKHHYTESWINQQVKVNNMVLREIREGYYDRHKDVICGLYWTYEMWTQNSLYEADWAKMFNGTRSVAKELFPDLPMMVCPFISQYEHITPEEDGAMWERFFKAADFHDGDIFCPQDSFGSQGEPLPYIEAHQLAMKAACKNDEADVQFWLDVENFAKGGKKAPIARFTKQLDICARIAEGLVSFSYSHYYDPVSVPGRYHKAYVQYVEGLKDLTVSQ